MQTNYYFKFPKFWISIFYFNSILFFGLNTHGTYFDATKSFSQITPLVQGNNEQNIAKQKLNFIPYFVIPDAKAEITVATMIVTGTITILFPLAMTATMHLVSNIFSSPESNQRLCEIYKASQKPNCGFTFQSTRPKGNQDMTPIPSTTKNQNMSIAGRYLSMQIALQKFEESMEVRQIPSCPISWSQAKPKIASCIQNLKQAIKIMQDSTTPVTEELTEAK